jgi:DNA-binding beta-propeller fold protein YncE
MSTQLAPLFSIVVPIDTATSTPGPPIAVGVNRPGLHDQPDGIAITPDGRTVYVANIGSGTVTPIDTYGHEQAGSAGRGRRAAPGDRDHPGRQDRLCRQPEQAAAPALA